MCQLALSSLKNQRWQNVVVVREQTACWWQLCCWLSPNVLWLASQLHLRHWWTQEWQPSTRLFHQSNNAIIFILLISAAFTATVVVFIASKGSFSASSLSLNPVCSRSAPSGFIWKSQCLVITSSFMIQWKLGCRSRKQKRKNQPIAKSGIEHCHWFILPLLLATPTMQFSLDRKQRRHKQNQCSASDSVGLIFTRSYRSTLLITTPTTTPSLVKTSLKPEKDQTYVKVGRHHVHTIAELTL